MSVNILKKLLKQKHLSHILYKVIDFQFVEVFLVLSI